MKAVTAEEERAAGATVRTKPDTVADAVADADRHRRVKTSIIVEIGDTSGDSPKRSVYNASQLTKPGIGIPKHLLEKYRRKTKT